jgi:hypothetical protein
MRFVSTRPSSGQDFEFCRGQTSVATALSLPVPSPASLYHVLWQLQTERATRGVWRTSDG